MLPISRGSSGGSARRAVRLSITALSFAAWRRQAVSQLPI